MKTILAMLGLGISSLFGMEEEFYKDRIDTISSYEVKIHTETELKDGAKLTLDGIGFVFGNYLLTAGHVTSKYERSLEEMTPYGPRKKNVPLDREDLIKEETTLDDRVLFSVAEIEALDISIFDLSKDKLLCSAYCNDLNIEDVLFEKDLYQGMKVYWIGNPDNQNGFYKESKISKIRVNINDEVQYESSFMMQQVIIPGSSGKSVWSDGKIVGIIKYTWATHGGVGFIDSYIKEIKKYELNNK